MDQPPRPVPRPSAEAVQCSVLVPIYNERRHIERALEAMREQTFAGTTEFVFADGGSDDGTRELLHRAASADSRLRVYDNPRRTVTSGLNVALSHARGRWVARMDGHTSYPPDYLRLGIERLQRGGTRWVSGPQLPAGDGLVSRAVALALGTGVGRAGSRKWGHDGESADDREYMLDTGVFTGIWERRTLLEYGGWDERWRVNEDSEMAARFLARGEQLICLPAMAARYVPRGSFGGLWRQYRSYGRYRVRTAIRYPSSMRRQHLVAPALVTVAVASPVGPTAITRPARLGLSAYAGLLGREASRAVGDGASRREAALVPVALATMHFAFGVGFWQGMLRDGIPWRAAACLFGAGRRFADPGTAHLSVFAPSLHGNVGAQPPA
jgi:succinoglycan biosynthesis protein ExoA